MAIMTLPRAEPVPFNGDRVQDASRRRDNRRHERQRTAYDSGRVLVTDSSGATRLSVSTTPTKFFHLLGREPTYLRLLYRNTDLRVWPTTWDATSVTLDCSGTGTVSVEVF